MSTYGIWLCARAWPYHGIEYTFKIDRKLWGGFDGIYGTAVRPVTINIASDKLYDV